MASEIFSHLGKPGYFHGVDAYKRYARMTPNCACTFDSYDLCLRLHADCPVHGDLSETDQELLAEAVASAATVEGIFKAHCGCRWATKDDWRDRPNHPAVACDVHAKRPTETCPVCKSTPTRECRDGVCKKPGYDPPPTHYATGSGLDPWAVWDAYDLDRYTANAVMYLLRAGKKSIAPKLDDLRKAANYVAKAIEMEEKREADQGSR